MPGKALKAEPGSSFESEFEVEYGIATLLGRGHRSRKMKAKTGDLRNTVGDTQWGSSLKDLADGDLDRGYYARPIDIAEV